MIAREQRHTRQHPCAICGGYDRQERGESKRCFGWTDDGWCHCSREEFAGILTCNEGSQTYAHRLEGDCPCGSRAHARSITSAKIGPIGHIGHANKKQDRIVAHYDYHDKDGKALFQVCRLEPKGFFQRRPDGHGGWLNGLDGVDPTIYHLPEILAAPPGTVIFLAEGEKDTDRLRGLGLFATTCPMGAGKWRTEYSQHFIDRSVVVIPDNDEPGQAHAQAIASSLHGTAASIRIVELPGVPEHGDVSDWLSLPGNDRAALDALVDAAPEWGAPEPPEPCAATAGSGTGGTGQGGVDPRLPSMPHPTDLGSSELFHNRFAHDRARYVEAWGWMGWDGARWVREQCREVHRLAHGVWQAWLDAAQVAAALAAEAEAAKDKEGEARYARLAHAWGQAAATCQSYSGIRNLLTLAESHEGLCLPVEAFDRDDLAFNLLSGTLDLRTGHMHPHTQADATTKLARSRYDPRATAPRWHAFLERVLPDPEVRHYLQRAVGYSLSGLTSEQCFFILHGPGANGKSVFCDLLAWLWGDYAVTTRPETFMQRDRDGIPSDVAALHAARLAITTEPPEAMKLNTSLVKQLTGGDVVTARFMYHDFFSFGPKFKLFIATNHLPKIPEHTYAMWRRIHLVEFPVVIPPHERDKHLLEKLKDEAAGILNWAVEGYRDYAVQGLKPPMQVSAATSSYRAEEDVVAQFLEECCTLRKGLSIPKARLYTRYQTWAAENGERPWSHKRFAQRMAEQAGIESERDRKEGKVWVGVSVGQAFS